MRRAFTLVELLLVVAIIGVVLGISVPGFVAMSRSQQLRNAPAKVQNFVYLARQYTVNRKMRHRIVFFKDRMILWHEEDVFLDRDLQPVNFDDYRNMPDEFDKVGLKYGRGISCILGYKPGGIKFAPEWNIKNVRRSPREHEQNAVGFKFNGTLDFFGFTSVPVNSLHLYDDENLPTEADIIFLQKGSDKACYVDIDPAGGRVRSRIVVPEEDITDQFAGDFKQ